MRLIDADELKEKLLKMQSDVVNEREPRGNTKSDTWKAAYLLIFDEYIKILDEIPEVIYTYDCYDILDAYGKGYLKGRDDILSEIQLMRDYCKNDCDTLNKIQKEQKEMTKKEMTKKEITRKEIWSDIIVDSVILDMKAKNEDYVPYMTDALVLTASQLYMDDTNGHIREQDKADMWSLIDKLGNYSIKGEIIRYLPEYKEIKKLVKKVF